MSAAPTLAVLVGLGSFAAPVVRPGLVEAPKVVSMTPASGNVEVDAKTTKRLVVCFDQDMDTRGFSFCGGGPAFPKVTAKPRWQDARTCVLEVELVSDHSYRLSVNCPAARSFRSKKGVPARATPWSFSTLPAELLPVSVQRKINKEALAKLAELLAEHYSYYEYHEIDWVKRFREEGAKLLDCRTTRGFAAAAAKLLSPSNDLHLFLDYRGSRFGAGRRAVDSLFRSRLLGAVLADVRQLTKGVLVGTGPHGARYIAITGWQRGIDFDAVEAWIRELPEDAHVVIDVRPNSGGGEGLAMRVARHFVEGNPVYAKHVLRKKKGEFGPVHERRISGLAKGGKRRVAVLMSRYCMSSCEAFLLMMKQAPRCKLVGQRSYGSSGNPRPFDLPGGVKLYLPCWKAMTPDGECFEGKGIAPDIEVVPDTEELRRRDPILERGLEFVRSGK